MLLDKCFHLPSVFSTCIEIDGWSTLLARASGILDLKMYFNYFFKVSGTDCTLITVETIHSYCFSEGVLMVILYGSPLK